MILLSFPNLESNNMNHTPERQIADVDIIDESMTFPTEGHGETGNNGCFYREIPIRECVIFPRNA